MKRPFGSLNDTLVAGRCDASLHALARGLAGGLAYASGLR
jgi:hypothetical protein